MLSGRSRGLALLVALAVLVALVLRVASRQDVVQDAGPGAAQAQLARSRAGPELNVTLAAEDAAAATVAAPLAAERAPAPLAGPTVEVDVVVLSPDGVPVRGARWAAFAGFTAPVNGTTAADGRVAFEAHLRGATADTPVPPVGLVVVHRGHAPSFGRLEPGVRRIVLEPLASIRGRVTVNREPPPPNRELELVLQSRRFFWGPDGAPAEVWEAVGGRPRFPRELTARPDADGAFAFEGLVPGFAGTLGWPQDEFVGPAVPVEGGDPVRLVSLEVSAPADGVLVALADRAGVSGVVLDPLTEEAVPHAWVWMESADAPPRPDGLPPALSWGSGGIGTTVAAGRSAEADGRFRLHPLQRHAGVDGHEVRISARDEKGAGLGEPRRITLSSSRLVDIGALYVQPLRKLDVLVRDTAGAPVRGAEVQAHCGGLPEGTARTDGTGRALLTTTTEATHVRVAALGFEPAVVPLSPAEPSPLAVTLEPGAMLEVRVTGDVVQPDLVVYGEDPPFLVRGEPSWRPERSQPSSLLESSPKSYRLSGRGERRFLLGDVRPGARFRVEAVGSSTRKGGSDRRALADVTPLARGEHRTVVLDVGGEDATLSGRVIDPGGRAIAGAEVMAADAEGPNPRTVTDADGRFAGLRLPPGASVVFVQAAGYAHGIVPDAVLGAPLEIVLQPGRDVRVRLCGPGDAPLAGARVEARLPDRVVRHAEERAPGEHVLRGLPDETLVLFAVAAGRTFEEPLRADEQELRVDVPAWGAVEASFPAELAVAGAWLRLRPTQGDASPLVHALKESLPSVRIDVVFAGEYAADVVRLGAGGSPEAVTDAALLHVNAGKLARVALTAR